MSDLRELLGDDDYEATIDKAVQTAERYFNTANYTHPDEGVTRCDYGCGVQLIERTIEHVTARILEAVLPDLLDQLARIDAILARSDHLCEPSFCDWKRDIWDIREVRGL